MSAPGTHDPEPQILRPSTAGILFQQWGTMIRRLRKLSWDGHRLLVRWDQARKGDWDEYELHCGEAPPPSLLEALQALTGSVVKICELTEQYCSKGFALRGVSISYTEADVMGATITALKYLKTARAPLVLNTPHLMAEPMSETDDAPLLPDETVTAIENLEAEAWRYVAGERAQGDLFAAAFDYAKDRLPRRAPAVEAAPDA